MILLLGLAFSPSFAQYEIKKYSINSGGKTDGTDTYQITGSFAQLDARSNQAETLYAISSGFWQENTDLIYKNSFE